MSHESWKLATLIWFKTKSGASFLLHQKIAAQSSSSMVFHHRNLMFAPYIVSTLLEWYKCLLPNHSLALSTATINLWPLFCTVTSKRSLVGLSHKGQRMNFGASEVVYINCIQQVSLGGRFMPRLTKVICNFGILMRLMTSIILHCLVPN